MNLHVYWTHLFNNTLSVVIKISVVMDIAIFDSVVMII